MLSKENQEATKKFTKEKTQECSKERKENRTMDLNNRRIENIISVTSSSTPPTPVCSSVLSSVQFKRGKKDEYARTCVICRLEGRFGTVKTSYCLSHKVSLCYNTHLFHHPSKAACPFEWSCWRKFHEFYQPKYHTYSTSGRIKKGTLVYKEVWSGDSRKRNMAIRSKQKNSST
jgi:hypothetical protein